MASLYAAGGEWRCPAVVRALAGRRVRWPMAVRAVSLTGRYSLAAVGWDFPPGERPAVDGGTLVRLEVGAVSADAPHTPHPLDPFRLAGSGGVGRVQTGDRVTLVGRVVATDESPAYALAVRSGEPREYVATVHLRVDGEVQGP